MAAPPVLCRSCQAPIRWAPTAKTGRPIPLNYEPDETGNVILERGNARSGHYEHRAVTLGPLEAELARQAGDVLFMPHHATCPQADQWKGPTR